jgi:hypothetical protein
MRAVIRATLNVARRRHGFLPRVSESGVMNSVLRSRPKN